MWGYGAVKSNAIIMLKMVNFSEAILGLWSPQCISHGMHYLKPKLAMKKANIVAIIQRAIEKKIFLENLFFSLLLFFIFFEVH